jgi:hypothetical protein
MLSAFSLSSSTKPRQPKSDAPPAGWFRLTRPFRFGHADAGADRKEERQTQNVGRVRIWFRRRKRRRRLSDPATALRRRIGGLGGRPHQPVRPLVFRCRCPRGGVRSVRIRSSAIIDYQSGLWKQLWSPAGVVSGRGEFWIRRHQPVDSDDDAATAAALFRPVWAGAL